MKARVHLILLLFHHLNDTSRFKVHLPFAKEGTNGGKEINTGNNTVDNSFR